MLELFAPGVNKSLLTFPECGMFYKSVCTVFILSIDRFPQLFGIYKKKENGRFSI